MLSKTLKPIVSGRFIKLNLNAYKIHFLILRNRFDTPKTEL